MNDLRDRIVSFCFFLFFCFSFSTFFLFLFCFVDSWKAARHDAIIVAIDLFSFCFLFFFGILIRGFGKEIENRIRRASSFFFVLEKDNLSFGGRPFFLKKKLNSMDKTTNSVKLGKASRKPCKNSVQPGENPVKLCRNVSNQIKTQ